MQGAQTYENIVYLNEALYSKSYSYLFDRLLNLGADTVIINKQLIDVSEIQSLKDMATKYGYEVLAENNYCILFKLKNVDYTFGVVNEYENLAIGTSARYISLIYPSFENTSKMLDDYTIDELIKYDKIYLSGVFYNDKSKAELMVKQLSNEGINIYIDINKIEQDFQGYQTFLNISSRILTLTEAFPDISYNGNLYDINYDMMDNWNASYITNIEDTDEYFIYANQQYSYLRKEENITYIGMNLIYFYNQYPTKQLLNVLNSIFDINEKDLIINKKIVKIEKSINNDDNTITITVPTDNTNTTLSYQDFFTTDNIKSSDNLLILNKGTNIIKFEYKYFKEGFIISIIGLIMSISLIIFIMKGKTYDK